MSNVVVVWFLTYQQKQAKVCLQSALHSAEQKPKLSFLLP